MTDYSIFSDLEDYSVFSDFEYYLNENEELIDYLEAKNSLLNVFIRPVIKTLNYLIEQNNLEGKELDQEEEIIFAYGFDYLFENLEQIKLYLKSFNGDYELLEKKSLYIRFVFELEELKLELEKREVKSDDVEDDIQQMDMLLDYFEGLIETDAKDEQKFEKMVLLYYTLFDKYKEDVVLITEAFSAYCATYGI